MNRCDLVILGCLYERDQHGYDIKSFVENKELNRWANISVSSIYHRLGWLSKYGFIESKEEPSSKTQRVVYSLTDQGRELLHSEVKEFLFGFNDDPRTLGLAFLNVLPRELAVSHLQHQIENLEKEIKHLKRMIRKSKGPDNLSPLSPLLNNMSLDHIRLELKYMNAALEIMADPKLAERIDQPFAINL